MTLVISTEAEQKDIGAVGQELHRVLQSLFERKLIIPAENNTVTLKFADDASGMVRLRSTSEEEKKEQQSR